MANQTPKVPGASKPADSEPIKQSAPEAPIEGLPNAIDIDPKTLTAPLLTRQGWLVPPDKAAPGR